MPRGNKFMWWTFIHDVYAYAAHCRVLHWPSNIDVALKAYRLYRGQNQIIFVPTSRSALKSFRTRLEWWMIVSPSRSVKNCISQSIQQLLNKWSLTPNTRFIVVNPYRDVIMSEMASQIIGRLDCLLNRVFRCRSKLRVTGLCEGNSPVNSPHKRPVRLKMFPFVDVIMRDTRFGLANV